MRVSVALDSFKGSLSSVEANEAVIKGILSVYPDAEINNIPFADGGEGSLDVLMKPLGCEEKEALVIGADGLNKKAVFGFNQEDALAVIEVAKVVGLDGKNKNDPLKAATRGIGQLIKEAISLGAKTIFVCLGGSSTNDGGIGMLQELGFSFKDAQGNEIQNGAQGLLKLASIEDGDKDKRLDKVQFVAITDSMNPLCGDKGATKVYGPQKGLTPADIPEIDEAMKRYSDLAKTISKNSNPDQKGAGAAGGLGFAAHAFLGASLLQGAEAIIKFANISAYLDDADYLITGEGKMDASSAFGKGPNLIGRLAHEKGVPTIALVGSLGNGYEKAMEVAIDEVYPIVKEPISLEEACLPENAKRNLEQTAKEVFSAIKKTSSIR